MSALQTVVASDARITVLQREAELLEADAEGASAAPPLPGGEPKASPPPPAPRGGGESFMVSELQNEIAKLSLEEKAARLAEVYEDLDVLASSIMLPRMFLSPEICRYAGERERETERDKQGERKRQTHMYVAC